VYPSLFCRIHRKKSYLISLLLFFSIWLNVSHVACRFSLSLVLKYSKIRTNTSSGKFTIFMFTRVRWTNPDALRLVQEAMLHSCWLTPVVDWQEISASGSSSWSQINFQPQAAQPQYYQSAITPNQSLVIHPPHTQFPRIIYHRILIDTQQLPTTIWWKVAPPTHQWPQITTSMTMDYQA